MVITAAEAFVVNSLKFYLSDIKIYIKCIHLNLCLFYLGS